VKIFSSKLTKPQAKNCKEKSLGPKGKGGHISCNILCSYSNTSVSEAHHLTGFLFHFEEDTYISQLLFITILSYVFYSKPHTSFI